jgi:hypothetical protein
MNKGRQEAFSDGVFAIIPITWSLDDFAGWRRLLPFGGCDVPKGQVCAARSVQSIHAEHRHVIQVVIPPA